MHIAFLTNYLIKKKSLILMQIAYADFTVVFLLIQLKLLLEM